MKKYEVEIVVNPDEETPVSVFSDIVRVDWVNLGEGICGDYNPNVPDDQNLLRFDVYYRESPESEWEAVEDASYCTLMPANANISKLIMSAKYIHDEYYDVLDSDPDISVKKLGEQLSWINESQFE